MGRMKTIALREAKIYLIMIKFLFHFLLADKSILELGRYSKLREVQHIA